MKKVKLTENQLIKVIKESVKKILTENAVYGDFGGDSFYESDDDDRIFSEQEKIKESSFGVDINDSIVNLVAQSCNLSNEDAMDEVISSIRNLADLQVIGDMRRNDIYEAAEDLGIESDEWIPYVMDHISCY